MSRIAGVPLRGQEITKRQLTALAEAIKALHNAVPLAQVRELMLLPGRSANVRNPPGTLERQARRFLKFFD
jgi:hypothetical protein